MTATHLAITPVSSGDAVDEPVSLYEANDYLRIEPSCMDDANVIDGCIRAARVMLENDSRQMFVAREFDVYLDVPPCDGVIRLPYGPLKSVTSIVGFDPANNPTTMAPSDYYVDTASLAGRIALAPGASWPSGLRAINGLRCRVVLGYSTSLGGVPDPIRMAMLQMVAFLYEHRGEGAGAFSIPPQVRELMAAYYIPDVA